MSGCVPTPRRRPDNIWGFPSLRGSRGVGAKSINPLWNVLTEPILSDYYTPKAGQAFESMEREYDRIGYQAHCVKGQVRMVRRRRGGGYFTILTPPPGATRPSGWPTAARTSTSRSAIPA